MKSEIKKAEENKRIDANISSHAYKYEIPDLDRTLNNDTFAGKPG